MSATRLSSFVEGAVPDPKRPGAWLLYRCPGCKREPLQPTDFYRSAVQARGIGIYCKACANEMSNASRRKTAARHRAEWAAELVQAKAERAKKREQAKALVTAQG